MATRDSAAWQKRVSGPIPTEGYGHKSSKSAYVNQSLCIAELGLFSVVLKCNLEIDT